MKEQSISQRPINLHEARETGCHGLIGRWAFSQNRRQKLHASEATHADKPFICCKCASPAVIRKGEEKISHFAHLCPPSQAPSFARQESDLHKKGKDEILTALRNQFPEGNWEKERTLKEVFNKHRQVRPDLSGRLGVERKAPPLVIEIQASALSISEIVKRIGNYSRRQVPILWVIPISEPFKKQRFRPWLYERFLHNVYFGRVYYWWPGMGSKVLPVHFGMAHRHIPEAEFYDQNGDFQAVGGYEVPLKIIKSPEVSDPIEIGSDFQSKHRMAFIPSNQRKKVPACTIWLDKKQPWWNLMEEIRISPEYYDYGG